MKDPVATGKVCPIFTVSSCTGEGIDLIRSFIAKLPKSATRVNNFNIPTPLASSDSNTEDPVATETEVTTKLVIDSRYFAKGVGLILGGTVTKGTIKLDQELMFGPDRNGNFRPVVIKGIHENRVNIEEAGLLSSICVSVKTIGKNIGPIKNSHIRKGSCLINPVA